MIKLVQCNKAKLKHKNNLFKLKYDSIILNMTLSFAFYLSHEASIFQTIL